MATTTVFRRSLALIVLGATLASGMVTVAAVPRSLPDGTAALHVYHIYHAAAASPPPLVPALSSEHRGSSSEEEPGHLMLLPPLPTANDTQHALASSPAMLRLRETTLWPGDHGILVLRDHPGWKLVPSQPHMVVTAVQPALGVLLRGTDALHDVIVHRRETPAMPTYDNTASSGAVLARVAGHVGGTHTDDARVELHVAAAVTTCQRRPAQLWAQVVCGAGFQTTLAPIPSGEVTSHPAAAFVIDARVRVPPGHCVVTLHMDRVATTTSGTPPVDAEGTDRWTWTGSCPSAGDGFQNSRTLTAWWRPPSDETDRRLHLRPGTPRVVVQQAAACRLITA